MKRPNWLVGGELCVIPGSFVARLMMGLATLTIASLVAIEVKRVLAPMKRQQVLVESLPPSVPLTLKLPNETLETFAPPSPEGPSTSRFLLNLFSEEEDLPHCPEKPLLMVLVVSAPENFEKREAIRRSWGKEGSVRGSRVVFLLGRTPNRLLDILLKNENEMSGDTLIGPYRDSYRNLTRKVLHGLRWSAARCAPRRYLLKTDDDCFVNLPLLVQFLRMRGRRRVGLYAGHVRRDAPVVRDPRSRWYVSRGDLQQSRYVPYVNGAGYVLSADVLRILVRTSLNVPPFPNEDAYVGTVLNAAGVRPTHSARFATHSGGQWRLCNFLYLFVVHGVGAERQAELRGLADRARRECPLKDLATDWS